MALQVAPAIAGGVAGFTFGGPGGAVAGAAVGAAVGAGLGTQINKMTNGAGVKLGNVADVATKNMDFAQKTIIVGIASGIDKTAEAAAVVLDQVGKMWAPIYLLGFGASFASSIGRESFAWDKQNCELPEPSARQIGLCGANFIAGMAAFGVAIFALYRMGCSINEIGR